MCVCQHISQTRILINMRCDCEDYPCCGHGDDDPTSEFSDMTDQKIKETVMARMMDDDYDEDRY